MTEFVHLHTHSYYSLLDGVASPEELIRAAKRAGMKALALTDHNGLYGAVEFYQKAREYGLKPIIGAELGFDDGHRLVLLVKNEIGYRHLCHLISLGRINGGHNRFKLNIKDLKNHTDGLIALSAGREGHIYHLLNKRRFEEAARFAVHLSELFDGAFFLEMQYFTAQDTLVNMRLRDLGLANNIPLAAGNDVHFIEQKDWHLRRVLHAIDANTVQDNVQTAGTPQQFLKSAAEMQQLFKAFPEALANTCFIADSCRFEFQLGRPVFPSIELPEGETEFSYLWKKSFAGATIRYRPLTSAVIKRLEYELQTINDLGFAPYFLIVKDIVDYCHREHIPCVGRGSAADSLVSYVLQITQVDPLRHKLYFERFLNPERSDPPDIDLDICWKNRDRVLKYVYDRFGHERTAMICTFNTFQNRSAIRDVAKTFGLPEDEISRLTKHLPHYAPDRLEEAMRTLPELKALSIDFSLYENIMRIARRISDFPRHLSIHPGGVIIAPDRITFHTPLERAGKDLVISQYDMYSIEKLGLVKMDLLGVRSLSVITDTLKTIKESSTPSAHGLPHMLLLKKSNEISPLDLRIIPENDPQVTAFIRSGQTLGCFQLESPAMRGLLTKMRIEHVDDVITAVALIRPGASGSGMKEVYIRRRAGLEAVHYIHPTLKPALEDTYGVIIYQEQVLQVAHFVAGLTLGQADLLRRAMTKSRTKKDFLRLHDTFTQGAREHGLSSGQAETVWKFLAKFVGYGFNKAHSATYGVIAYQTAYLKYYFPAPYMCAVLNNQGGFYSAMAYVEEARRMGLTILPPDVHRSQKEFTCEQGAIRTGLQPVLDLTRRTMEAIVSERTKRPFRDLFDFVQRTRAGRKEVEHLIKVGALNSLHPNEPDLLLSAEIFFKNQKKSELTRMLTREIHLPPFNRCQKIINELELLGFAITAHPLTLYSEQIKRIKSVSSFQLSAYKNRRVTFVGWLVTMRRVTTAGNQLMKFLTLEDLQGLCEAVLFPAVYNRYGHLIQGHGPYVVTGRVQSGLPGLSEGQGTNLMNLIVGKIEVLQLSKEKIESAMMVME